MLELLQRIPENPAVSCAMPILRMEHDSDLLTDQHGKHLDGEGVPQRVWRHVNVDAETAAARAGAAEGRLPGC